MSKAEPEQEPESYGAYVMNEELQKLIKRGMKAYRWAQVEYTIAKNVFPPGHRLRKQKLAERVAVGRWIKDVVNFLETGNLPEPPAQSNKSEGEK